MKYIVVWYQDSMPMGSKEFDDLDKAQAEAKRIRELELYEDVTIWDVKEK